MDVVVAAVQGKVPGGDGHGPSSMEAVICAVDGKGAPVNGIGTLALDPLLAGGVILRLGGGSGLGVRGGGLIRPAAMLAAAQIGIQRAMPVASKCLGSKATDLEIVRLAHAETEYCTDQKLEDLLKHNFLVPIF